MAIVFSKGYIAGLQKISDERGLSAKFDAEIKALLEEGFSPNQVGLWMHREHGFTIGNSAHDGDYVLGRIKENPSLEALVP